MHIYSKNAKNTHGPRHVTAYKIRILLAALSVSGSSVLQKLIGWQLLWCCVDILPSLRRVLLAAYHGAVANWGSGGSWEVQDQSGISVWIWLNYYTLHQPGPRWYNILQPQAVGLLAKGLPRLNFLGVRSVQSGRLIWICFWMHNATIS